MKFKNGARRVSRRVDIIRNGAAVTTLDIVESPVVSVQADAVLKANMTGVFRASEILRPTSDLLQPVLILGGVDYPLGQYAISVLTENHDDRGTIIHIEAYDRALWLQQSKTEVRYYIAAGTKYVDAVQAILLANGIERVISDPCDAMLATAREDWEVGTDYLTIINTLLSEINYTSLWFDFNGIARLHRYVAPGVGNIRHIYRADEMSIIKPDTERELDIFDAPNVFVAIVSNPEYDEPMIATAVNDSVSSALSTINRRRRIVSVETLDNIASQDELQAYVNNKRAQSMISTETVRFYTANNPEHSVGDVIALHHEALEGVFEETAWSITLEAGADMTHEARRAMYL